MPAITLQGLHEMTVNLGLIDNQALRPKDVDHIYSVVNTKDL